MSPVHWVLEARVVGVQVSSINEDLDNAANFCKQTKWGKETFWQASRSATAFGKGTQSPRSMLIERQVGTCEVFFFSKTSWRGFHFILKKLEPHRWGRGQPHAKCRWHVGSCSSRRSPRCRSPSRAPSGHSWSWIDITIVHYYGAKGNDDTLSLLPFTFLDSMWTRLRPSSSNTLRALESPTMPLKVLEVDLLRQIMEHLTLCRGNITAVLNTPSRLRKW